MGMSKKIEKSAKGKKLRIKQSNKRIAGRYAKHIKSVAQFLGEALEQSKKSGFVKAIEAAVPWAEPVMGALAEALPPLKFLNKLLEIVTEETEPEVLGYLACTIAFERAVEMAVGGHPGPVDAGREVRAQINQLDPVDDAEIDLLSLDLDHLLSHDFTRRALKLLRGALVIAGYSTAQTSQLISEVKEIFPLCLEKLLRSRKTSDKFKPWSDYLQGGGSERYRLRLALKEHLLLQRWLFDESPLLGNSPFSLKDVFLDLECSEFAWEELVENKRKLETGRLSKRQAIDPFLVHEDARKPLLDRAMHYVTTQEENEIVIIQGGAGTGKSSFTIRLCQELYAASLTPIRIRLRKVRLDQSQDFAKIFSDAVEVARDDQTADVIRFLANGLFEKGLDFQEESEALPGICQYVLILDGWDEISISNDGFKQRVGDLLNYITDRYLTQPDPKVRVILTGRPSTDVTESELLTPETPILTIQPLRPNQLKQYARNIAKAVRGFHRAHSRTEEFDPEVWPKFDEERVESILAKYNQDYSLEQELLKRKAGTDRSDEHASSALSVMGLPLLAHLIIRLISEWRDIEPEDLVDNPTRLYRNLVNLTCEKSGQTMESDVTRPILARQAKFHGRELRELLQKTAAAMSVFGQEMMAADDLSARLGWTTTRLDRNVSKAVESSPLSRLMVSYYFKGGYKHLGCEYVHKSFREYLFAEAIIETLKQYAAETEGLDRTLPDRVTPEKDYDEDDPRRDFAAALSRLLAPRWLTQEVVVFLADLIVWEVRRESGAIGEETGLQTDVIDLQGWKRIRDALADLWAWWIDGCHQRLIAIKQNDQSEGGVLLQPAPLICELIEHSASRVKGKKHAPYTTITSIDSHLGAGLCRLTSMVHTYVAGADGWLKHRKGKSRLESEDLWQGATEPGEGPHRFQTLVRQGDREFVLFAPSGAIRELFFRAISRINATMGRPQGFFPEKESLAGVDLR